MLHNISKKMALILIFVISLSSSCVYFSYNFYQIKNFRFFEIKLKLPDTSQGEIAELYRQSPFKSLRIAFAPQEMFSEAAFAITATKNETLDQVEKDTLNYLSKYYMSRKPYPTFQEHEILKIEKLENSIKNTKSELEIATAILKSLKGKYSNYQASSFIPGEEKIIEKEIEIQTLQKELEEITSSKNVNKLKIISSNENLPSPFSISTLLKAILIFTGSALILFALAQNKKIL